jgi:hypothetical protein
MKSGILIVAEKLLVNQEGLHCFQYDLTSRGLVVSIMYLFHLNKNLCLFERFIKVLLVIKQLNAQIVVL